MFPPFSLSPVLENCLYPSDCLPCLSCCCPSAPCSTVPAPRTGPVSSNVATHVHCINVCASAMAPQQWAARSPGLHWQLGALAGAAAGGAGPQAGGALVPLRSRQVVHLGQGRGGAVWGELWWWTAWCRMRAVGCVVQIAPRPVPTAPNTADAQRAGWSSRSDMEEQACAAPPHGPHPGLPAPPMAPPGPARTNLPHGARGLQPLLEVRLDGAHQLLLLPLLQLRLWGTPNAGCGHHQAKGVGRRAKRRNGCKVLAALTSPAQIWAGEAPPRHSPP